MIIRKVILYPSTRAKYRLIVYYTNEISPEFWVDTVTVHTVSGSRREAKRAFPAGLTPWAGYALAIAAVLLAWVCTLILRGVVPDRPLSFTLFFAAVALSAGLAGLGAGVLATLLSALICDYFFLAPLHSFTVATSDLPLLVLFIIGALLMNGLTGRLRAQTRDADQRYYGLVQGLDGIVWEANPRTLQFTFISQRAEILLGYPVEQWMANSDFRSQLLHPEDVHRMLGFWREAVKQGGEHAAEYRAIAADAREVWIRETVTVVHNAFGRPVRMTGLGVDITQRKAEAEELTRTKDEFALLNEISAALCSSLELPDFVRILQTQLSQHLGVEAGGLYLVEESADEPRLIEAWGIPHDVVVDWQLPWPSANPEGANDDCAERIGCALPGAEGKATPSELSASGWPEALTIPLLAKENLLGALCLISRNPFLKSAIHAEFYSALGRQIGALLQNVNLYREVRLGRERLQQLSRQLVNVQEMERRAIARELHDEIGQLLTGLKLTLEMSARAPRGTPSESIDGALKLVQDLIGQVEGLSLDLRPAMLDDLGLLPAMQWHCRRYTALTGISVNFAHSGVSGRFPAEVEITAYRIIQEALTNVARHARVDHAGVRLWATRDMLGIQVADDGCGFELPGVSAAQSSGGLTGMQERAGLIDGCLTLETGPGIGTSITVELPLNPARPNATAPGDILLATRRHDE